MADDFPADYLHGLTDPQRESLARVNHSGLMALRERLARGEAVAFLGAGVSAPLYPLWNKLIGQLVEAAADRLTEPEVATCRALTSSSPEEVVEIVRRNLGTATYREVLREVLRTRTDPASGRSWTPAQELVCRCAFKAVVTTNYDSGIVDARMRVRPGASATGFTTWEDELGLDRWRTGKVFGDIELPVLYAHGQYNRPDSVVLATAEYRRAYEGKLAKVLERLVDSGHLVWIGFSFADQRIAMILREVAHWSGTQTEPGAAPEHVAIMPWDPGDSANDPRILAQRAEIGFGARVVLYPTPDDDHSALLLLLEALADPQFPPVSELPARSSAPVVATTLTTSYGESPVPATWVPEPERVEHFTGRSEELARLDRWAADPQVALVGVTAWGGAGKTALVTHWVREEAGAAWRPSVRGVFGWSFYGDPSAENWAAAILEWARRNLGISVSSHNRAATAVLGLLRTVPLLLVLDGLEVAQEGPAGVGFGRLLDSTLREVLSGACQLNHRGLIVLTSRFPFADLETFDGGTARMLEVPPLTPAEGSELLAASHGDWLDDSERRAFVQAVDGHALAVEVLAGLLADRPPASDLAALHRELDAATRTSVRVSRVLRFYADRLSEADRYLLAAVSLFARPVPAEAVLAVAAHPAFAGHLAGWNLATVEASVRDRLAGLASWHLDGSVTAHPLVRDTFRPLVMAAAKVAAETALTGVPRGKLSSRTDALRVVEAIELLLDAGQWKPADDIYRARSSNGALWQHLPAARCGQRAAAAFVVTPDRREACTANLSPFRKSFYLNEAGLHAMNAADLATAREYLTLAAHHDRDAGDMLNLSISLQNLAWCLGQMGEVSAAHAAAGEALSCARIVGTKEHLRNSNEYIGWLAGLGGDAAAADRHFTLAAQTDRAYAYLYSQGGYWWAEWLIRTERPGPAQKLTFLNRRICQEQGWNSDVAGCNRLLGRLALIAQWPCFK